MRRILTILGIGALACLLPAPAANAQGTASKPAAPAQGTAGETKWEGFYAGAGIGLMPRTFDLGASTETINQVTNVNVAGRGTIVVPGTTNTLPASSPGDTAFLAGVQAGYNRRFGSWLGGVEGGLDFGFGTTSTTFTTTLPATALTPNAPVTLDRSARANVLWSLKVRAGYLWNDYLFYGTAGLAGANVKLTATDTWSDVPGGPALPDQAGGPTANLGPLGPYVTTASESHHRVGFTFGLGAERPITPTMNVAVEYRHTGFASDTYALANPSIAINGPLPATGTGAQVLPGPATLSFTENRVTVRVTLKLPFRQ
jgi:opacity protein-like surface antigen